MPVDLAEPCVTDRNPPARVQGDEKEVVRIPCPNHEYRSCAKRMGQIASRCRLCLNQQEMAERWRNIRKAFMTIRSYTRKRSAAQKEPVISPAARPWKFSIVASLHPDSAPGGVRVLIGIECGQKVLSND
jgi:hypothetical protein